MSWSKPAVHAVPEPAALTACAWTEFALDVSVRVDIDVDEAMGGDRDDVYTAAELLTRMEEESARGADIQARALESAVEEAYQRGREEGRAEGAVAAEERLNGAVAAVNGVLDALGEATERRDDVARSNLAALSTAVARRLLSRELEADPGVVENLVADALAEFPLDQTLRVRLNPEDLERVSETAEESRNAAVGERPIQWTADAAIARGGCLLEGPDRIVDGRIDKALERVYRRLIDVDA